MEIFEERKINSLDEIKELTVEQKFEIVSEYRNRNKIIMKNLCEENYNNNRESFVKFGSVKYVDTYAPFIFMELSKKEIITLSTRSNITHIFYTPQIQAELLLHTSREVTRANIVQTNGNFGQSGNGVNLGLIDRAFPVTNRPALLDANITLDPSFSSNIVNSHATNIAEIMVSQGANNCAKGLAPDANLYCTILPTTAESIIPNIHWLIDNNVDIVNISLDLSSIDRNGNPIYNNYNENSYLIDYYSANYLLTFVVACGNFSTNGVSDPAIAYNVISVGNLDDQRTSSRTDDQIHYTSSHINQSNITNLPSKPDICAPGTNILLDLQEYTGTSYAAPHVAASAALIGETDPMLLLSPVALKATLVAGTNPSLSFTPSQKQITTDVNNPPESYIQCGAGLVDCVRSGYIAKFYQYDFGVFGKATTENTFTINLDSNKETRVALTFEKSFSTNSNGFVESNCNNNLDLYIYDVNGNLVCSSTTTNNNVEIVDFTPASNGNYTIKICRQATTNPSDVRFAYAWLQG